MLQRAGCADIQGWQVRAECLAKCHEKSYGGHADLLFQQQLCLCVVEQGSIPAGHPSVFLAGNQKRVSILPFQESAKTLN
jgi:hypothetical protein